MLGVCPWTGRLLGVSIVAPLSCIGRDSCLCPGLFVCPIRVACDTGCELLRLLRVSEARSVWVCSPVHPLCGVIVATR